MDDNYPSSRRTRYYDEYSPTMTCRCGGMKAIEGD